MPIPDRLGHYALKHKPNALVMFVQIHACLQPNKQLKVLEANWGKLRPISKGQCGR